GERAQRRLDERQFVRLRHRAGNVYEEDEVGRRQIFGRDFPSLEADVYELVLRVPGAARDLRRDGEGRVAGRLRVVVREVVDQLLDADGVARRQLSVVEEAARVAVGGRVNVNREGRERRARGFEERVLVNLRVRLAARDLARLIRRLGCDTRVGVRGGVVCG